MGTPELVASRSEVRETWGPQNLWLVSQGRAAVWRTLPLTYVVQLLREVGCQQFCSPLHPETQWENQCFIRYILCHLRLKNEVYLKSIILFLVHVGCLVLKCGHIGSLPLIILVTIVLKLKKKPHTWTIIYIKY